MEKIYVHFITLSSKISGILPLLSRYDGNIRLFVERRVNIFYFQKGKGKTRPYCAKGAVRKNFGQSQAFSLQKIIAEK
jgi:hypothetical protein